MHRAAFMTVSAASADKSKFPVRGRRGCPGVRGASQDRDVAGKAASHRQMVSLAVQYRLRLVQLDAGRC
eukprot:990185-Prymnesium_polylepis.1